MAERDYEMGLKVHEMLKSKDLENPIIFSTVENTSVETLERHLVPFCRDLGLDAKDDSTENTPHRLAKMYKNELCWGLDYRLFPHCMITANKGALDEMVIVKNVEVMSLCEHHFMPVLGVAHIAYIPNKGLLGLSKFNRLVKFFARRPQLQERMGAQIMETLKMILGTDSVAVIVEAEHFCVKFRGVEDSSSSTVSSHVSGKFTDAIVRSELLSLIKG